MDSPDLPPPHLMPPPATMEKQKLWAKNSGLVDLRDPGRPG